MDYAEHQAELCKRKAGFLSPFGAIPTQRSTYSLAPHNGDYVELHIVATPYSHPLAVVRELRFHAACRIAADLMRAGRIVYSPVAHSHPIAQHGLPTDWSYWERADRAFIEVCDDVVVLKLDGWRESEGVQCEIQIATELGKPVRYIEATM